MLRELRIKNLALIDDAELSFEPGFTVLTGETGAGKSILVGAIGLLLGERASVEQIRNGTDEADVSGIITFSKLPTPLAGLLNRSDISCDGGELIIRRRINRNGRNSVFLNQVPVPLATLKTVGDLLIDLHGQHEHQSLLSPESHLRIIDTLSPVLVPLERFSTFYGVYAAAEKKLADHTARAQELNERRDIIEFQYKEIAGLALSAGEELELEEELTLVSSSTQRQECASSIQAIISEGEFPLSQQLSQVIKQVTTLSRLDPSVASWAADIGNTRSILAEFETFCSAYLEKVAGGADPDRMNAINDRLAKIQRLKKKYKCDTPGLIDKERHLKDDLASLENIDADRELLVKTRDQTYVACKNSGTLLGNARRNAALDFDRAITLHMEKLGFKEGAWRTDFVDLAEPGPTGSEECSFMVRTNSGEPFLPLSKTASGGEISRLMLAVKTVLASQDNIPILIFDEIDTGIGGILAKTVADALVALSKTHQVLCISHLQQIASMADHHYNVSKETEAGRTVTRVRLLRGEEKVAEIARMLGGETEISRKHARELLKRTR